MSINREPMLDMFIFESIQLIEKLEESVLNSEKLMHFEETSINEIFRIMHTIKGSAAMMLFNNISELAHSVEDVFYFIREEKPKHIDCSKLTDIVLASIDFIKDEISKLENGKSSDGNASMLIKSINDFLTNLKQSHPGNVAYQEIQSSKENNQKQKYYISYDKDLAPQNNNTYKAVIFFEEDCQMENMRAFNVIHDLKEVGTEISYFPSDIIDNDESEAVIKKEGFTVLFKSDQTIEYIREFLGGTIFLKKLELEKLETNKEMNKNNKQLEKEQLLLHNKQKMISVRVTKLDELLDLVGELVISEAMVTQNPELEGLPLDSFYKAARRLKKITSDLQDTVMSIRMVPLSTTFQKMNRLVRDMSHKTNKDIKLQIVGEETEVDKNIIEHIGDPLMHIIRNAIDHGIETVEERLANGKEEKGKIILEAKNAGGEVWITVKDNGRGMDKNKILEKAKEQGLVPKTEQDMTDKEIYSLLFLPGFSTKDKVTEFSGRGVGMDVVMKNIEKIRGSISVESTLYEGSAITLKIPLTLAIIDGMIIKVGNSTYTIPTIAIKESFRPKERDVIMDPEGEEMIFIRGKCYSIVRLHKFYKVQANITKIHEGIIIMVESGDKIKCIFADALVGEQQVVIKPLPPYFKKVRGVGGCTILGDGSISLILDMEELIN